MGTKITSKQVEKIAKLCELTLSQKELETFAARLSETLNYIDNLNELDTSNTLPTSQVAKLKNVFIAADTPITTLPIKEALKNSKEIIKGKFATAAVFER
jgi:aspartyl-tRNA(Asn)/glutamyl-tRNA(Gln) amidotransferase subunit C